MDRKKFRRMTESKVIVLDGSSGVALQKRGMPAGVCPENWAVENPEPLIGLQKEYIEAGSEVIYTFSLGGTSTKLDEFDLGSRAFEINRQLAVISGKAAGDKALVAGDIGPSGHMPMPFGEVLFDRQVEVYKEQVRGLLEGGVDFFIIETMMDIQDARAALLAVKETCSLPVIVSMTYDKDKRTLTGSDPVSASITLQALGADAVGANCSTGPAEMVDVIKLIKPYLSVPVLAKPNAGLPKLVNGKTVFDMQAPEFCSFARPFVDAGVNFLGGCCGTTPEYIKQTAEQVKESRPKKIEKKKYTAFTSARKTVFAGEDTVIVGERINPTGKKKLQEDLKAGRDGEIRRLAFEQAGAGAEILDVNTGMPEVDEKSAITKAVNLLSTISEAPLCVDSASPDVIEAALRVYPGRALINSVSGEKKKMKKLLPIAAKYGAGFILLPLDDDGIHPEPDKKMEIVNAVAEKAREHGLSKEDIIVDGLVMTVSSDSRAAVNTLEFIKICAEKGMNTIAGLSNVSFGLPRRGLINSTFYNLAKEKGLSFVIANPSLDFGLRDSCAEKLLLGKDKNAENYIKKYSGAEGEKPRKTPKGANETGYDAVVKGNKESITEIIENALEKGEKPSDIVDNKLIPAINHVGELYDKKIYFLPQLIQSAEAMKTGFARLEPLLEKKEGGDKKIKIVLATVKGDIHDIGKNIVALMLKNYGYEVIDLGRDVSAKVIIGAAKEHNAAIIGLSALMTTTMPEMEKVVKLAGENGVRAKIITGGAVVNSSYAEKIGAAGYAKDAYDAVRLVKRMMKT